MKNFKNVLSLIFTFIILTSVAIQSLSVKAETEIVIYDCIYRSFEFNDVTLIQKYIAGLKVIE